MKYKFKFSVLIPIYNVEGYIEQTIKSIIKQTIGFKQNIQIILINDGSPDNSEKICLKYQNKYPENIVYIKQKNAGVSATRNNGMQYIEGKYVNFLDSDDLWTKNAFKVVWDFFEKNKNNIDVVACRLKFFGLKNNYQILDYKFDKEKIVDINKDFNQIILSAPSTFIKASAIKGLKFDKRLKYGEDAVFINKIILNKEKYGIEPKGVYLYRKRLSENSAVDTATRREYYYNESIDLYLKELIDYTRKKTGIVNKFIQTLVLYDLFWRFTSTISNEILNTEKKKIDYINKIIEIVKKIEDDVILNLPIIPNHYKLYFLTLKHGKTVYNHLEIKDNHLLYKNQIINSKPIKNVIYKKIRTEKNKYILHGKVSFFNINSIEKFVIEDTISGEQYIPKIYKAKTWDEVSCTGDIVRNGYLFRVELPIKKKYKLKHYIYNKQDVLLSQFGFSYPYKLSDQYDDFFSTDSRMILNRTEDNTILEITKFNVFILLYKYIVCLFSLLKKFKLKTFIKKIILPFFKAYKYIKSKTSLKNIIILESNPDYTGNVKEVFDLLIKNRINDKYKIVWFVDNEEEFKDIQIKNVEFLSFFGLKPIQRAKKTEYYYNHAKLIIDSNKYVKKRHKNQIRIHLNHGSPFKNAISYNINIGDLDYDICQSSFFQKTEAEVRDINVDKVIPLGFPRNDILYKKEQVKFSKIDHLKTNKIILWLPTYRNHNAHNGKKSKLKYGLSCVNTKQELLALNSCLKKEKVTLLIKFHPAENLALLESFNLSNIVILKDSELEQENITLYQLFGKIDALITDYSSVYFDFCLTKKNIGLAISDFEDYAKEQGDFQFQYQDVIMGDYMYNNKDLLNFVKDVANNKDKTYKERMKLVKKYDDYRDGKATERVYEFIKKFL